MSQRREEECENGKPHKLLLHGRLPDWRIRLVRPMAKAAKVIELSVLSNFAHSMLFMVSHYE
jgi:hypothetical protein